MWKRKEKNWDLQWITSININLLFVANIYFFYFNHSLLCIRNFHNVSLGQGQEIVAEQALDIAAKDGHWVVLQV